MVPFTVKQIQKRHLEQIETIWQLDRPTFDMIINGTAKRPFWYSDKHYGKCLVIEYPNGALNRLFIRNHHQIIKELLVGVPQMFV